MQKIIIACFTVTLLCLSCDPTKENKDSNVPGYDRATMLKNLADNIILPSYQDLSVKTDSLLYFVNQFINSTTGENLGLVQTQWKSTATAYKKCEMFKFGPAEGVVMLDNEIDFWPTNATFVDNEISGTSQLDSLYASQMSVSRKGLPALEYLIFDTTGNNAVLSKFTSAPNFERRKMYLRILSIDLKTNCRMVHEAWKNSYASVFIASQGTEVGSSVSLLLNQLISTHEVLIRKKLGGPLGKLNTNDTSLHIKPKNVEAYLSAMSISHMLTNVETLENIFTGKNGPGFDHYLSNLNLKTQDGQPLNESVKNQIQVLKTAIRNIPSPISQSIAYNSQPVINAWRESKRLLVLLKVDVSSGLGIQITFTDNDGD